MKAIIDEYIPESKEIDINEIKNSETFCIKKYQDAIYFGEGKKNA